MLQIELQYAQVAGATHRYLLDSVNNCIEELCIDITCRRLSPLWVVQQHTIGVVAVCTVWIREGILPPPDSVRILAYRKLCVFNSPTEPFTLSPNNRL